MPSPLRLLRISAALSMSAGLLLASGCISFHTHRTTTFRVFDADSRQPIAEAKVAIDPIAMFTLNTPKSQELRSDFAGSVTSRIATYPLQWLKVSAEGYATFDGNLPDVSSKRTLLNFYYPKETGDPPRTHAEVWIPLYRKPSPTITFVTAARYRGPIKIFWAPTAFDDPRFTPSQREFRYEVDEYGDVAIAAPPLLLRDLRAVEIRVESRSGEVYEDTSDRYDSAIADPDTVLLRRVDSRWERHPDHHTFNSRQTDSLLVIGTPADSDFFYRQVNHVTRDEYGGRNIALNPEGWDFVMRRARSLTPQ